MRLRPGDGFLTLTLGASGQNVTRNKSGQMAWLARSKLGRLGSTLPSSRSPAEFLNRLLGA